MADTNATSDLSTGLVLLLGAVTALASIGTGATAYLSFVDHSDTMQLYSGLLVAAAMIAGGIAVAAVHLYD